MHFTNSLFTVQNRATRATGGSFKLRLEATHPIYQGHFPDNPITPGVCSLEMMTELVAAHFDGMEQPTGVDSIKFLNFVNPLRCPEVKVELKINRLEEGGCRVHGALWAAGKAAVKMVARYQNDMPNLKIKSCD